MTTTHGASASLFPRCCLVGALLLGPALSACDWPWALENPHDARRCDPECPSGQICYDGACVQCTPYSGGGASCKSQGFTGGTLRCRADNTFDTSGCYKCGDGKKGGKEQCDGSALGGASCSSLGLHTFGKLTCSADCTYFRDSCYSRSVPAGRYQMGSPSGEKCRESWENQHEVTLTRPFEITATEVTQGLFKALMGYNPSANTSCGDKCPVEQVNWHEAAAYCNALSRKRGLTACYACSGSGAAATCSVVKAHEGSKLYACPGYRLPTNAEFEYAHRAGTFPALYVGPISNCTGIDANANKIGYYKANSGNHIWAAARKQPNKWGLYDMAGNVIEWCNDDNYLHSSSVTDPHAAFSKSDQRIVRSGSVASEPSALRAASYFTFDPTKSGSAIGFRWVRSLKP